MSRGGHPDANRPVGIRVGIEVGNGAAGPMDIGCVADTAPAMGDLLRRRFCDLKHCLARSAGLKFISQVQVLSSTAHRGPLVPLKRRFQAETPRLLRACPSSSIRL